MRKFHLKIPVYIPDLIYWLAVRPLLIYRRFKYGYSFRKIPLTQGKFAKVDEKDYQFLRRHKWQANKSKLTFYAVRGVKGNRRGSLVSMHREIMDCPKDKLIDHINHDGLDNRRANLRIVSLRQNNWNKRKQRRTATSKYKGVYYHKRLKKWYSNLTYKGNQIYIGLFDNQESAAKAYDEKAKELFGEFACLNFHSEPSV